MNKIIMLAFAMAMLASPASAEWQWKNFGVDPYASSRNEAMETREIAFQKLGLPQEVIQLFIEETKVSGDTTRIVNGDRFSAMLSKGGVVNKDVVVNWNKPPIKNGKMEYAAPAEKWQISWNEKTYVVFLPEVCNNWCWEFGPPPASAPEKCVEIIFNAPIGGKVRWGIASDDGPFLPSACNAQKQGEDEWTAWVGQCDDCVRTDEADKFIRNILGNNAEINHKYLYEVTQTLQTLRFSTYIWTDVVYICLEYPDGSRTNGVYIRPKDWKGEYKLFIEDRFWISDSVDWSKLSTK